MCHCENSAEKQYFTALDVIMHYQTSECYSQGKHHLRDLSLAALRTFQYLKLFPEVRAPHVFKSRSSFFYRVKQSKVTLLTKSLRPFETSAATCPPRRHNVPIQLYLSALEIINRHKLTVLLTSRLLNAIINRHKLTVLVTSRLLHAIINRHIPTMLVTSRLLNAIINRHRLCS